MTEEVDSQAVSIRDVLRSSTQKAHLKLHMHSCFVALFDGSLNLSAYRQLMRRLHGFYAPLDQAINRTIAKQAVTVAGYKYANRSSILAQDLMDLDFSKDEIFETQKCRQAFEIVSSTSLGGVLYVVEGATLGGTGIDRYAQKLLGQQEPAGRRYWAWCRAKNKQRWPMALSCLEHLHDQGVAIGDLVAGANDTFQTLADWMAPLDQIQTSRDRGQK